MDKTVGIYFGILSDTLDAQLKKQGFKYNKKRVAEFEKQRDAINVLRFSDLLTDGMTDKIFKKLHSKIVSHVAKENKMKVIKNLKNSKTMENNTPEQKPEILELERQRQSALDNVEAIYYTPTSPHYKDNERYRWAVTTINKKFDKLIAEQNG
jgi:hypothetical protein